MLKKWFSAYVIGLVVILNGQYALACSVAYISSPEELVSNAELIVLATALDYVGSSPGSSRTTGVPETTVRFRVESVLKGTYAATFVPITTGGDSQSPRELLGLIEMIQRAAP